METNVRQWEIQLLPLERIKPCPKQPRTQFPEASRAELVANLRANGQQEPIIVYAKDGFHWIISGGRRYQAAPDAGLTHLRAVISPVEPEPKELLRYQLLCNAHRLDLNPMELCDSYQRLMEGDGLKATELASVVSKSKTYVSNVLSLASLSPHAQQLVREGRIGLAKGALLARLSEDALQKALDEIENGNVSRTDLEQKAAKKRGRDKPVRRVALELPTATINLIGKSKISVEQLIELLQELVKHCRKARSQGLDLSTLASILRDQATQPDKGGA